MPCLSYSLSRSCTLKMSNTTLVSRTALRDLSSATVLFGRGWLTSFAVGVCIGERCDRSALPRKKRVVQLELKELAMPRRASSPDLGAPLLRPRLTGVVVDLPHQVICELVEALHLGGELRRYSLASGA